MATPNPTEGRRKKKVVPTPAVLMSDNLKAFNELDEAVQDDVLEWADWTYAEWATSFMTDITAGEFDEKLPVIAMAARNRWRMSPRDNEDWPTTVAPVTRLAVADERTVTVNREAMQHLIDELGRYAAGMKQRGLVGAIEEAMAEKPVAKTPAKKAKVPAKVPAKKAAVTPESTAKARDSLQAALDKASSGQRETAVKGSTPKTTPKESARRKRVEMRTEFSAVRPDDVVHLAAHLGGDHPAGKRVKKVLRKGTTMTTLVFTDDTTLARKNNTEVNVDRLQ